MEVDQKFARAICSLLCMAQTLFPCHCLHAPAKCTAACCADAANTATPASVKPVTRCHHHHTTCSHGAKPVLLRTACERPHTSSVVFHQVLAAQFNRAAALVGEEAISLSGNPDKRNSPLPLRGKCLTCHWYYWTTLSASCCWNIDEAHFADIFPAERMTRIPQLARGHLLSDVLFPPVSHFHASSLFQLRV